MKHGPIALLDESTPVICVVTDSPVMEKMLSNWWRSAPEART